MGGKGQGALRERSLMCSTDPLQRALMCTAGSLQVVPQLGQPAQQELAEAVAMPDVASFAESGHEGYGFQEPLESLQELHDLAEVPEQFDMAHSEEDGHQEWQHQDCLELIEEENSDC